MVYRGVEHILPRDWGRVLGMVCSYAALNCVADRVGTLSGHPVSAQEAT